MFFARCDDISIYYNQFCFICMLRKLSRLQIKSLGLFYLFIIIFLKSLTLSKVAFIWLKWLNMQ